MKPTTYFQTQRSAKISRPHRAQSANSNAKKGKRKSDYQRILFETDQKIQAHEQQSMPINSRMALNVSLLNNKVAALKQNKRALQLKK